MKNKKRENLKFIYGVEGLVNPIEVGTLHFLQSFSNKMPKNLQKKVVESSAKKNPLMGFIVEPYSYFLCYEIKDKEFFQSQLPKGFSLIKTKVFTDDEPKYYFIIGCFNTRTSAFFGSRVECYVIALNQKTGLTSWVIIDYLTNTISYDSKNGLTAANSDVIITTNCFEKVIVKVDNHQQKQIEFSSAIDKATEKQLDYKLWIEGNLSIAYGKQLSESGDLFALKFNPYELQTAHEIASDQIEISVNNLYSEYVSEKPNKLVCFKYAQHFLSDSPGITSKINNEEELKAEIEKIDFSKQKVYSSTNLKRLILIMPLCLVLVIIGLLLIIIK